VVVCRCDVQKIARSLGTIIGIGGPSQLNAFSCGLDNVPKTISRVKLKQGGKIKCEQLYVSISLLGIDKNNLQ